MMNVRTIKKNRPPKTAEWILKRILSKGSMHTSLGDFEEEFSELLESSGYLKARIWYRVMVFTSLFSILKGKLIWSGMMFNNYIKTAIRNMKKQKGYTFINICGLALGIACCLAIYLYIDFELSYDRYHNDLDRIYRVAVRDKTESEQNGSATICAPVGQVLRDYFPQVEKVARLLPANNFSVKQGGKIYYENSRIFAETELFGILALPFIKGDPNTALDRPETLVLSEKMAVKYFGSKDPMGKSLEINNRDYEITGVIANPPPNTHLKYEFLVSMSTIKERYPFDAWFLANMLTYVKFKPNTDFDDLQRQMSLIADKYAQVDSEDADENPVYFLQPVRDIHLHSLVQNEPEPGTKSEYILIFSAIGIFILLIACVNFINLSTARAAKRTREVGIRKVVGAHRKQLIWQFLSESLIITIFSVFIALLIMVLILPIFCDISHTPVELSTLFTPKIISALLLLIGFICCFAGGYLSFILSAFRPVQAMKLTLKGSKGAVLRNVLVVLQFTLSILLIIGTMIVFQQLNYMKNKNLGFSKDQKLIIPLRIPISITDNYETVKAEFKKYPGVLGVTASSIVPGQILGRWDTRIVGNDSQEWQALNYNYVDPDFLKEYGLTINAGRFFKKEMQADLGNSYVLNIAAVKAFGWTSSEEALGKTLTNEMQEGTVIGVIRNFHYKGLQSEIEPLAMMWYPRMFGYLSLTLETTQLDVILSNVRETWNTIFPDHPFDFFFLDEFFDRQYRSEEQISKMLSGFTSLGIFIACLGLLGLASFTAEQKTKEIGIRKVLGASVHGIIGLLTKNFMKLVLLSNIIAWPAAFFIMRKWLQNFAYRKDIQFLVFILSAGLAFLIALLSVCFQALKAARSNPTEALKYE